MKNDVRKEKVESNKLIPLNYNYLFTGIFNDENNINIVECYLAIYFKRSLSDIKGKVSQKSRKRPINSKNEKDKEVDLLLELDNELINVEVSNAGSQRIVDRDLVYISHIHGGQLKYSDNTYKKINRTIQIRINNYHCNENKLVDTYYLRNEDGEILSKKLQIDQVDLVNAKENRYNEDEEKLARFCRAMLLEDENEIRKEIEDIMGEEVSEQLIDEIKKYSSDEEFVHEHAWRTREELERNLSIAEARDEGEKHGIYQTKLETAQKMLEEKLDIDIIKKVTGLTHEQINSIKNG